MINIGGTIAEYLLWNKTIVPPVELKRSGTHRSIFILDLENKKENKVINSIDLTDNFDIDY